MHGHLLISCLGFAQSYNFLFILLTISRLIHEILANNNDYLSGQANQQYTPVPQFQQHNNILHFVVPENAPNGTYLGNIRSTDGQPPYLILPIPPTLESERVAALSINLSNGDLTTNSVLDREQRDHYSFVAIVKEPFAEIKCTVTVRDVNDNAPTFLLTSTNQPPSIVIEMPEGQRGFRRSLPIAYDRDSPLFGIQEFNIVSEAGNTPKDTFTLVEHGAPPRSSLQGSANVAKDAQDEPSSGILLGDTNNPHLMKQLAQLSNVLIPSQPTIFSPSAIGPQPSSIHSIDVETTHILDRENRSDYYLVVEVRDRGLPPLIGRLNVTIIVQDINDNDPIFTKKEYECYVKEDAVNGTLLIRVQANDADIDANAEITYFIAPKPRSHLSSSTSQQAVSSNSNSSDNIQEASSATSSSTVRYNSSNKLRASQLQTPPSASPSSNSKQQRNFDQQQATTSDLSSVAQASPVKTTKVSVPYSSGSSSNSQQQQQQQQQDKEKEPALFEIDPIKGEIYLTHPLDFETEPMHEFVVEARDHGKPSRSGFATVKVIVLDVNDDPPPPSIMNRLLDDGRRLAPHEGPPSEAFRFVSPNKLLSGDILTTDVSLNYATLINWFAQINPTFMFFFVLGTLGLLSLSVCLIKIKSRHPETDHYNDTAGLTLISNNTDQLKQLTKNHSLNSSNEQQQQQQQQHHPSSLADTLHRRHHDGSSFAGLIMDGSAPDKLRYQTNPYTDSSNLYHNPYSAQQLPSRHYQTQGRHPQLPLVVSRSSSSSNRLASNQMLVAAAESIAPPSVIAAATPAPTTLEENYNNNLAKWIECDSCSVSYNWNYLADWTPEYHTIMPLLQADRFMR